MTKEIYFYLSGLITDDGDAYGFNGTHERAHAELDKLYAAQDKPEFTQQEVKAWIDRNDFNRSIRAARVAIEDARTLHLTLTP